jgi:hypothetical protein
LEEDSSVDYRGQALTLYPTTCQVAALSPSIQPPAWYVNAYELALTSELARAGLTVKGRGMGEPDQPLVVVAHAVRVDPGSQFLRWGFSMLAGFAVLEVQGQVGTAAGPIAQFHAKGVRRWGFMGGDSSELLADASRLAGISAAQQILAILMAL